MYIELSSGDLVKSSSGKIFEILALRNYGRGYLTVVLINRDTREDFEVEFCNFKTEYKLLTDFDVSKQYVEGMDEGIKEGYNSGYDKGFVEGYNQHEYEIHQNLSEKEKVLKTEAWEGGYDQCICDLIEEGVLESADEEYLEYKFGAVEDEEGEYCFIEELKKVLGGEYKHPENSMTAERKHSHYFKDVRHLDYVDIYQVCKLFEVEDSSHCTQHSIKKLLMSGKRGAKDKIKDITEARDTLSRYLQIEGYE